MNSWETIYVEHIPWERQAGILKCRCGHLFLSYADHFEHVHHIWRAGEETPA